MTPTAPTRLRRDPLRVRRHRLPAAWRRPLAVIGTVIAFAWFALAALAPVIATDDPNKQKYLRLKPPGHGRLFGTDGLGRDILSRVLYGARTTVPVALLLVVLSVIIGGAIGAVSGYFGGWLDLVLMRVVEMFFAFPPIILAMAVAAALGPGLRNAVLAVVVVSWPSYARVVRSLVLSLRESDFVSSARLLGASSRTALRRDVLPNVAGPVLVLATLDIANAILLLSGLSFLGLGQKPPAPEWGKMVSDGTLTFDRWWVGVFPGLAIMSVVLAFNFLGDSLRDALDPRTTREVHGRAM